MRFSFPAALAALLLTLAATASAADEDGYDLWLRYRPLDHAAQASVQAQARSIVLPGAPSPTTQAAVAELQKGLGGMLGKPAGQAGILASRITDGALLLATPARLPELASAASPLRAELAALGGEGYLLRQTRIQNHNVTLIAANTDIGLLYGAYAWLRNARHRRETGSVILAQAGAAPAESLG
ncbi:conserved hypothetical protein [Ricinus communis]|uniref:Alpha glucuronidase N-terminal domain-containing protein n=1 Tax=Ricinus communis TaxID=3988 RepID=B9TJN9_RICCO|nr:conserved hypothetical protein [Ricinus communis]